MNEEKLEVQYRIPVGLLPRFLNNYLALECSLFSRLTIQPEGQTRKVVLVAKGNSVNLLSSSCRSGVLYRWWEEYMTSYTEFPKLQLAA